MRTVFITGGTGLIGSRLILWFLKNDFKVICYGRSVDKILRQFSGKVIPTTNFDHTGVDYVIHAACPTTSSMLKEQPVEVIDCIYTLTKQTLDLANRNSARYMYLSSMEVYGSSTGYVSEDQHGVFDLSVGRNSYPVAKQLAELLVNSYNSEFAVKTCIVRLSQIFGPGARRDDNRLFYFVLKQCLDNNDIVLKSPGRKWHNSCYIDDAVNLMQMLLTSDVTGTFNITNETYCMPINALCKRIIDIVGSNNAVQHDLGDLGEYPPESFYKVSGNKIRILFPDYKMTPFEQAIKETYNYLKSFR